ncbi:MAG: glucose-1-phosphate adenylyltransferase [Candidatus Latescibacteria bacterium]|nr:glucose-1-phosphate adenylyltransferase [Candidatus Latescibacterota bacterium]
MKRVLAVILGGGRGARLQPLTKLRAKPAVPIAGKFRLIDIPISNCLNAGINHIYILTQFNSVSLHRHINQTYKFDTFSTGFIEVLAAQQTLSSEQWYQGTADAVRQQFPHFRARDMDYFLILSGDHLYQMDYNRFIDYHRESGADLTVAVKPVRRENASNFGILKTDYNDRIKSFSEKPPADKLNGLESQTGENDKPYLASMGIYIFNRGILVRLLTGEKGDDFGNHIIPSAIKQLNVKAYKFHGYWEDIGTIKTFFEANLALTDQFPAFDLYRRDRPIYTRPRYLPASKLISCHVNNSMVCEGCIIEESYIERSVIGIRSKISPGVKLKRVIMMGADSYQTLQEIDEDRMGGSPITGIGMNSIIENAIIDKNARIGDNVVLVNKENVSDFVSNHLEVRDGIIVVYKDAIIPSGTVF